MEFVDGLLCASRLCFRLLVLTFKHSCWATLGKQRPRGYMEASNGPAPSCMMFVYAAVSRQTYLSPPLLLVSFSSHAFFSFLSLCFSFTDDVCLCV